MASPDVTKIKVGGSGALWKAPTGTTLPTDSTTAWNAGFINLGYGVDGFEFDNTLKTKEVTVWQSGEVARLINTGISRKVTFAAIETNNQTVALAWGGATITPGTAGAYTLVIPDPLVTQEFTLGIDWSDGTTSARYVIPRAALASQPKVKVSRMDAIVYSLEIQALLPTDGSAPVKHYGKDAGVAN